MSSPRPPPTGAGSPDSGATLVSTAGAATLTYQPSTNGSSQVLIAQPGGGKTPSLPNVASGEISGLLSLRNNLLPAVSVQLSNYVTCCRRH